MSRDCRVQWRLEEDGTNKSWRCVAHLTPTSWVCEAIHKCYYANCPGRSNTGKPLTKEEMNIHKLRRELEEDFIRKGTPPKTTPPQPTPPQPTASTSATPKPNPSAPTTIHYCSVERCKKPIPPTRKSVKYCSENCRKNAFREKKKKQPPTPPSPPTPIHIPPILQTSVCQCVGCSNTVTTTKYCSSYCRKKAFKQRLRGIFPT